jgi:hypothetical protein
MYKLVVICFVINNFKKLIKSWDFPTNFFLSYKYIMPVPDIDGGLVWKGFSPRTETGRLPKDRYVSRPFYFGASNVRNYLPPVNIPSVRNVVK